MKGTFGQQVPTTIRDTAVIAGPRSSAMWVTSRTGRIVTSARDGNAVVIGTGCPKATSTWSSFKGARKGGDKGNQLGTIFSQSFARARIDTVFLSILSIGVVVKTFFAVRAHALAGWVGRHSDRRFSSTVRCAGGEQRKITTTVARARASS